MITFKKILFKIAFKVYFKFILKSNIYLLDVNLNTYEQALRPLFFPTKNKTNCLFQNKLVFIAIN